MVIYRATLSDGPQYHQAALFRSLQDVAAWLDFDIGQEKPLRVEKGLVVKVIEFDVFDRYNNQVSVFGMDIVSDDDVRKITDLQERLSNSVQKSPKVLPLVKATNEVLGKQVSEYRAGRVRSGGQWMDKSDLKANTRPAAMGSIIVAGRTYAGAKLLSAKEGMVALAHDGGIAKIQLASLNAVERQKLASALGFDLAVVGGAAPVTVSAPMNNTVAPPRSTTPPAAPAPISAAQPAVLEIDAQGAGTTSDEALKDALRDAVRRAVGAFISAEQVVKNDEIIRDQVTAHSDAFVEGYDKTTEKLEAGLFLTGIRARVVRSKLAERLAASGLIGKAEIQGENMFAEALTKLDKANSAKELLTKLFTGFPHVFCRPQLIGKPAITGQTENTATMRLRVRVGVDQQAYATWYQQAVTVLGQVCAKKQPFSISRVELEEPENLRESFKGRLYDETLATANDDPEISRFNPRLDGLVPVLKSIDQALDLPRVGFRVFVSKSIAGFSGDAYDLGGDEMAAVLKELKKSGKRGDEAWRKLDRIKVDFLDASGVSVRAESLDLKDRRIESSEEWLAPYGGFYGGGDSNLQLVSRAPYDDEHAMLIQPGFLLCRRTYSAKLRNRRDAVLATAGVAFDFVLEVPMDEIRKFQRLELSWQQD